MDIKMSPREFPGAGLMASTQRYSRIPVSSGLDSRGHSTQEDDDDDDDEEEEEESEKLSFHTQEAAYSQMEIERLENELEDSRRRIERDTEVISNLYKRVTELEELVQKQRITISNQSRTISDRRALWKQQSPMTMFAMSPHQHNPLQRHQQQQQSGVWNSAVSSPFETPQSNRSFNANIFDQPPPKFELPFGCSFPAYTPVVRDPPGLARNQKEALDVFTPLAASAGAPSTPIAPLTPADFERVMSDFSSRFQALMRKSEMFGKTHAGFPNIFRDSHLDDRVKEYLMAISNRVQASVLLGNTATRCCLVTKAVNYYLVREVLKITIIRGFDISADLEIGQIQKQMAPDTPLTVRHLMITAMSTHANNVVKKPVFAEFSQQKTQSHITKLWQVIAPIIHDPGTHTDQAWIDITTIVSEAQALAVDMYMVPVEYKFEFPEPGEHFEPLTMINRDPFMIGDPQLLKNNDTRVRLGISPIARIRNTAEAPGDIKLIYRGDVLLKLPRKQVA